ncbi:hypothetical protein QAD02_000120 [Eretmocerus hayati]|uniref:Uncharacterized protein n=1 Tax=Eretmocerus hayati TaxID=131215 RepID=A0ACC2NE31_9HYME|nr:hypothetical protein QAD02_000120 [Eretmocerus hayati]
MNRNNITIKLIDKLSSISSTQGIAHDFSDSTISDSHISKKQIQASNGYLWALALLASEFHASASPHHGYAATGALINDYETPVRLSYGHHHHADNYVRGSLSAHPIVVAGPETGHAAVIGPSEGPVLVQGPRQGSATIVGPSEGPATVVGPRAGAATIVGPTAGAATIIGPSSGGANIVGPSEGPAIIVGPSTGGATIVGPTDGGATVVGPTAAGATIIGPKRPIVHHVHHEHEHEHSNNVVCDLQPALAGWDTSSAVNAVASAASRYGPVHVSSSWGRPVVTVSGPAHHHGHVSTAAVASVPHVRPITIDHRPIVYTRPYSNSISSSSSSSSASASASSYSSSSSGGNSIGYYNKYWYPTKILIDC